MTLDELLSSFEAKCPKACNEDDLLTRAGSLERAGIMCTKVLSTVSDLLRLGLHSSGALPIVGPIADS